MSDDRPDLTTTEARQGNRRGMNSRALLIGIAAIVVLFALAIWFATTTYQETPTTTGGGATIEDTPEAEEGVGTDLDAAPLPVPEDESVTEPAGDAAPAEATPVQEAPADVTPLEETAPAAE